MGILADLKYHLHILEAMAFNRKDGIDKVNELLNPIIHHLIKIAIYMDTKDRAQLVDGWADEVLEWLNQIYEHCNNLKRGKKLHLSDYLLCLSDDLGRSSLVRSKVNKWSRTYKDKCNRGVDDETLRGILWEILEAQFKDMADECWDDFSLLNHPKYIALAGETPLIEA